MVRAPIARSFRYLYCIPPHTHALMRFRVQSVSAGVVAYYEGSGVTVDSETAEELPRSDSGAETGPIRTVPLGQVDVIRTWEGAPPDCPVFYSSVESYRRLHEMALARYGLRWTPPEGLWSGDPGPEIEVEPAGVSSAELDRLRRAMMEAHPDHGGTAEAFKAAHAAYEAARRQRATEG